MCHLFFVVLFFFFLFVLLQASARDLHRELPGQVPDRRRPESVPRARGWSRDHPVEIRRIQSVSLTGKLRNFSQKKIYWTVSFLGLNRHSEKTKSFFLNAIVVLRGVLLWLARHLSFLSFSIVKYLISFLLFQFCVCRDNVGGRDWEGREGHGFQGDQRAKAESKVGGQQGQQEGGRSQQERGRSGCGHSQVCVLVVNVIKYNPTLFLLLLNNS